ncbi:MAG: AsmA-like C-terminal region-containing protein [Terracidiphilus sp.]
MRESFWRRHWVLKWTAIAVLAALVALAAAMSVLLHRVEPIMRARIVSELQQQFHARVELDSFHVSLASGLQAEGRGLRIWPPAEVQGVTVPAPNPDKPLISLDEFRFRAPLNYKPGEPIRVSVVQLRGLTVDMPPKSRFTHKIEEQPNAGASKFSVGQALIHFSVSSIACTGAHLILETSKPGKLPLEFEIASLKLTGIQPGWKMLYSADLTNALPVGTILTSGNFGPWKVEDPGESAIAGKYDFEHANLGDFKGIAGMLNSTGNYQGTLRDLTVDGETDTPDFRLTHFGAPMALHTQFHALVDGTNGDTRLEPVAATLGQSHFTAQGQIVGVPLEGNSKDGEGKPQTAAQSKGHLISLVVDVAGGRMEDFLRLVSKSGTPLLTGTLTLKTSLDIPPGNQPLEDRIRLKGTFSLEDAQFTDAKIQDRIAGLSLRGQGRPKDTKNSDDKAEVRSTMQSDFEMAGGVVTLPDLVYTMPGTDIEMNGTYGVEQGALNFSGTAKMQATVSQMIGGWKGLLLKPADRLFKKDGAGTEVPIHIDGTRQDPHFSVDFDRMKNSSAQRPDQSP